MKRIPEIVVALVVGFHLVLALAVVHLWEKVEELETGDGAEELVSSDPDGWIQRGLNDLWYFLRDVESDGDRTREVLREVRERVQKLEMAEPRMEDSGLLPVVEAGK